MITLSCLLAFVQLTWQADNGWFSPVFDDFVMEVINIGPACIRGWAGGAQGWSGWWQKLK